MRLYLKLFALIAFAWFVQVYSLSDWRQNETVFIARCYFAELTHDKALELQLTRDARYFVEQDLLKSLRPRSNATLPAK